MKFNLVVVIIFGVIFTAPALSQKVIKESIRSQDKGRSYYLFMPENLDKTKPAPLIIMLHGSGRNGLPIVDKWTDLAKTEGIILAGPDASTSQGWRVPEDGPDFIYDMVESLKVKHPINPRRVYLFGHSAGATIALYFSCMESEYFAATVIHAGALRPEDGPFVARTKRKIPISMFVGTNDPLFPVSDVRATRDMLNAAGLNAQLTEIKGHTHDYYGRSKEINKQAWDFLKAHELGADPKYERYKW